MFTFLGILAAVLLVGTAVAVIVYDRKFKKPKSADTVEEEKLVEVAPVVEAAQEVKQNDAPMSKIIRYIIATVACIVIYLLYFVLTAELFGWHSGGGTIPLAMFIFFLVFLWKKISLLFRENKCKK